MENNYLIDVPVALVFFNRPEVFEKVFESVKKARPSVLFLIQDAPRENNESDKKKVEMCRRIAENIDWNCTVYKDYATENLGCGLRIYSGVTKAFEAVDRLIILEDDCLPSDSFYMICKEVLERYKLDPRIGMISGMNHLGVFEKTTDDYFFSEAGSIAGWATWKRAWEKVEYNFDFFNDDNTIRLLKNVWKRSKHTKRLLNTGLERKRILDCGGKLTAWSYQRRASAFLENSLNVIPKYNLMSNIGLTSESVHSVSSLKLIPRKLRFLYNLKLYNYDFPLKHPKYIIEDYEYTDAERKLMSPQGIKRYARKCESIFLRLIFGGRGEILKMLRKVIQK